MLGENQLVSVSSSASANRLARRVPRAKRRALEFLRIRLGAFGVGGELLPVRRVTFGQSASSITIVLLVCAHRAGRGPVRRAEEHRFGLARLVDVDHKLVVADVVVRAAAGCESRPAVFVSRLRASRLPSTFFFLGVAVPPRPATCWNHFVLHRVREHDEQLLAGLLEQRHQLLVLQLVERRVQLPPFLARPMNPVSASTMSPDRLARSGSFSLPT